MSKLALKQTPDFSIEQEYDGLVVGIDEAGRGPLAGPVVAACAYISAEVANAPFVSVLNDSKKLTAKKRELLEPQIIELCPHGLGICSAEEIDTLNIHQATLLAMRRAYHAMLDKFDVQPDAALIDGKFTPNLPCEAQAVIKGDGRSCSIAAASILAKVHRDRLMLAYHEEHPHYGWDRNAGYGTKAHIEGLNTHGVTVYHRKSFAPVRDRVLAGK